jgi:hypothetical protein
MPVIMLISTALSLDSNIRNSVLLGTKYFGRHFSVTSKQINVNQA